MCDSQSKASPPPSRLRLGGDDENVEDAVEEAVVVVGRGRGRRRRMAVVVVGRGRTQPVRVC